MHMYSLNRPFEILNLYTTVPVGARLHLACDAWVVPTTNGYKIVPYVDFGAVQPARILSIGSCHQGEVLSTYKVYCEYGQVFKFSTPNSIMKLSEVVLDAEPNAEPQEPHYINLKDTPVIPISDSALFHLEIEGSKELSFSGPDAPNGARIDIIVTGTGELRAPAHIDGFKFDWQRLELDTDSFKVLHLYRADNCWYCTA